MTVFWKKNCDKKHHGLTEMKFESSIKLRVKQLEMYMKMDEQDLEKYLTGKHEKVTEFTITD